MESSRVCPLPLFSSGKDNYEDLQSRSLIHMDNKLNDLVHNLECWSQINFSVEHCLKHAQKEEIK